MRKITPGQRHPLHGVNPTRRIEQAAAAQLPPNTLMQRAGLAVARLALAIAPHAQRIWIACGPGNNGGDGMAAALHLTLWGKQPIVTWLGSPAFAPADTLAAYQRLLDAGISMASSPPSGDFELCVDALLGIGGQLREPQGKLADWIRQINASAVPVLAVDVPTGLQADTGDTTLTHVSASHTLSLLTLKPGLFTAQGRDTAGIVWLDTLGLEPGELADEPTACLNEQPKKIARLHASHKGSYGDVAIIGGAPGMSGAALLAASAALHAGAGRVFVGLLDDQALTVDIQQPELMFRPLKTLDLSAMTVVCGCGGGLAIRSVLDKVLSSEAPVLLDADALNEIANSAALQARLTDRASRHAITVLTPHPLEASRLLATTARQVQGDRLASALTLAQRFACTVVLKGSGSVIASPGEIPVINPTGNARLSSAGTGDVLAGMVGAQLAAGKTGFDAACQAVYLHGALADSWPPALSLTAGRLARGSAGG